MTIQTLTDNRDLRLGQNSMRSYSSPKKKSVTVAFCFCHFSLCYVDTLNSTRMSLKVVFPCVCKKLCAHITQTRWGKWVHAKIIKNFLKQLFGGVPTMQMFIMGQRATVCRQRLFNETSDLAREAQKHETGHKSLHKLKFPSSVPETNKSVPLPFLLLLKVCTTWSPSAKSTLY